MRFQNAAKESASLIVCGRAFLSLGAELKMALKPNCWCVFQQHLESVGVVAMMSKRVVCSTHSRLLPKAMSLRTMLRQVLSPR